MSHHSDTRMRIIMIIKRINRTNRIEWLPLRDTHCSGLLFQGQASRTEVLVPLVYSVYSGVHLHRTAHRLNSPALLPAFSFFLFPIFSSHPFSVGHPASFLLFLFSVCFSLFLPLSLSLSLCVFFSSHSSSSPILTVSTHSAYTPSGVQPNRPKYITFTPRITLLSPSILFFSPSLLFVKKNSPRRKSSCRYVSASAPGSIHILPSIHSTPSPPTFLEFPHTER